MLTHKNTSPSSQYKKFQQHLDNEHKRLMNERQQMLQRQSERLQVYQKIDLVQFFNYDSVKQKKEMMYHLSNRFRQHMRKLTENNVYRRVGCGENGRERQQQRKGSEERQQRLSEKLVIQTQQARQERWRQRSNSIRSRKSGSISSSKKSNVQRNSDLGRMFQTMRYYQQQHKQPQSSNINQSTIPHVNFRQTISHTLKQTKNSELKSNNEENTFSIKHQSVNHGKQINRKLFENDDLTINSYKYLNEQNHSSTMDISIQQLTHALYQQQKIYLLSQLNHYIKAFKESQVKRQFMQKHLENLHQFIVEGRCRKGTLKSEVKRKDDSMLSEENGMLRRELQIYKKEVKALTKMQNQDFLCPTKEQGHPNQKLSSSRKCIQAKKIDRFKQFAHHIQFMQDELSQLTTRVNSQRLNNQQKLQNSEQVHQLQQKVIELQQVIAREESKKCEFFQQVKKFKAVMKQKDQQIVYLRSQLQKHSSHNINNDSISQFINRTLNQPTENKQFRYSTVTTNLPSQPQSRSSRASSRHSSHSRSKSNSRSRPKTNYQESYQPRPYERYYDGRVDCQMEVRGKISSMQGTLYQRIGETER